MIHGVLNVYKEKGFTSHDVVAKLRGIVGQRKIGHTGTLDPDAQGVLPVCLGKATKLCDLLTEHDKVYETVLHLGVTTDTQDISGNVLAEMPVTVSKEDVNKVILSFEGSYEQLPPMYSAIKMNGKKLYELARAGKTVERKTRLVTIYGITILEDQLPDIRMRISCSKGTYIRTICHDIGQQLGCGGVMKELLRTKVGSFSINEAWKLDELQRFQEQGTLVNHVTAIDEMFPELQKIAVTDRNDRFVYCGNPVGVSQTAMPNMLYQNGEKVRLYDSKQKFIGIFSYDIHKEKLCPVKMFYEG